MMSSFLFQRWLGALFLITITRAQQIYPADKCRLVCSNLKTNWRTDVCAGAAKIKAQPGVYKACNNGKLKGFEHACMPTCTGEKYRGRNSAPGNSFDECKSEWKKPRPNNYLIWCRRGYDITYEEVTHAVDEIVDTWSQEKNMSSIEDGERFDKSFDNSDLYLNNGRNGAKNPITKLPKLTLNVDIQPDENISGHASGVNDYQMDNKPSLSREALDTYSSPSSKSASGSMVNPGYSDEAGNLDTTKGSFVDDGRVIFSQLELSDSALRSSALPSTIESLKNTVNYISDGGVKTDDATSPSSIMRMMKHKENIGGSFDWYSVVNETSQHNIPSNDKEF